MVNVVEVQAMNILEMHLVAWSFKSKQRSMWQDRALMTEEGMMLLTTARHSGLMRICTPDLHHKDKEMILWGSFVMKRGCVQHSTQLIMPTLWGKP